MFTIFFDALVLNDMDVLASVDGLFVALVGESVDISDLGVIFSAVKLSDEFSPSGLSKFSDGIIPSLLDCSLLPKSIMGVL